MDASLFPNYGFKIQPYDEGCYKSAMVENLTMHLTAIQSRNSTKVINCAPELSNTLQLCLNNRSTVKSKSDKNILKIFSMYSEVKVVSEIVSILRSPTLSGAEKLSLLRLLSRIVNDFIVEPKQIVDQILLAAGPFLMDGDFYVRMEARDIICVLSTKAGLVAMVRSIRRKVDSSDPITRDMTARTFALVGKTLGVCNILPFVQAICAKQTNCDVRLTGVLIVRYIASEIGFSILPFLLNFVSCIKTGLMSKETHIRIATALSLAQLAVSAYPHGDSAFLSVLPQLWEGIKSYRANGMASYLNAFGCILRLLKMELAQEYTSALLPILRLNFKSSHGGIKIQVLRCLQFCIAICKRTKSRFPEEIFLEFFSRFWARKVTAQKEFREQVLSCTISFVEVTKPEVVIGAVFPLMKDASADNRILSIRCCSSILGQSERLRAFILKYHSSLVNSSLHVFEEDDCSAEIVTSYILLGIKQIFISLGSNAKDHLPGVYERIMKRLRNEDADRRKQACRLIALLVPTFFEQNGNELLSKITLALYESLGEEYPNTLGAVLDALTRIIRLTNIDNFQISIDVILRNVVPILRNRHEKVQMNCIFLVGSIAKDHAMCVPPREWMRICLEITEMLKASRKSIRRAAVESFGLVARAIGPQDVLYTLLQNLRLQERQNRVCTTVAIAIVAESCGCYTVLPGLMNEFRVPDNNVQNGVLKALSFMFEYISYDGNNYLHAVSSLLVEALSNRDTVHRQISATTIKHVGLGIEGCGHYIALMHFMNFLWPNIYEQSPHVFFAVKEAIHGIQISLGVGHIFCYYLLGLFHPARRVRESHWDMYNSSLKYSGGQFHPYYTSRLNSSSSTQKKCMLFL